jgi:hypothetical protein
MALFLQNLNLYQYFDLEMSDVALSLLLPLSYVLLSYPTLKLFSLSLVIFRHPYLAHMKFDIGIF